jgi:homoserine O-acetyltransferase
MISYRSPCSMEQRFGRTSDTSGQFAVNSWLKFHGAALVERFDAHSYRILLDAMDTHDLARDRGEYEQVLKAMTIPVLIGTIDSDTLYVSTDQYELARNLPNAQLLQIDSHHGHDGFLIDAEKFSLGIHQFLNHSSKLIKASV